MFISPAYAQDAAAGFLGNLGQFGQIAPLVLIFAVFYFLMIRPQQKKQKELKAMLAAVKKGDRVLTSGGILGTVAKVTPDSNEVELEIATGVKVIVLRETLNSVIRPKAANDSKPA